MDKVQWFRMAAISVNAVSRTAKGVSDTSLAVNKPGLMISSGDALRLRASRNLDDALRLAWAQKRRKGFRTTEMTAFIESLARHINEGLVESSRPLFRTWPVKYAGPVPPEEIQNAYAQFCLWLATHLPWSRESPNAVRIAALAERRLNREIHPFADGCGRISRVLGAWILLRTGHLPAFFPDHPTYYEHMGSSEERWIAEYEARIPRS